MTLSPSMRRPLCRLFDGAVAIVVQAPLPSMRWHSCPHCAGIIAIVALELLPNIKRNLTNHLLSTILSGQHFVFLFCQGTEQPHQGKINTRVAIPNTTKEVRYQIRLDRLS